MVDLPSSIRVLIDQAMHTYEPGSKSPPPLRGDPSALKLPAMAERDPNLESRMSGVESSMARLEGAVEGLKHSQNIMLGVLGLAFTIGVFGGGYLLTRVDALGDAVSALPQQINSNLIELNKALSESITAARSGQQPQPNVIVVPGDWHTSSFPTPPKPAPDAQLPPP